MTKKMWKKIYGQARMWVNARELTLDPMPYTVEDTEDSFVTWWCENWGGNTYIVQVFAYASDLFTTHIDLVRWNIRKDEETVIQIRKAA